MQPDGSINPDVPVFDAVAIHHNVKIKGTSTSDDIQRTMIFIQAQTQRGEVRFVPGGLERNYIGSNLGLSCTPNNYFCAMLISQNHLNKNHLNKNHLNNNTTSW
jgi:alpha-amylase